MSNIAEHVAEEVPGGPQVISDPPTHLVAIGASAGGLEALENFFDHLPKKTGMAFVVIQHLSPDFKSLMDELLGRHTQLPIHLVEDGMEVAADHVYLIPPKKEMIVSRGRLLLSERDRQKELSLPIDLFFRSLAQDYGPRAVAIVLSGGGSDGSRGVRDIHESGGLVIVQDEGSAQFGGMPRTARDSGVADHILPPEQMPDALVAYAARGEDEGAGALGSHVKPRGLETVYRMLEQEFGIDFTHYKPSTVTRRIERRLALARSNDIDEYVARLKRDRDELDVLYRDLLIGVTRFFRDPEAFQVIESMVLRPLVASTPPDSPLRLWVAGCATGEEAYSLAIILQDLMRELGERRVKIFATDVHPGSLERAARGEYEEDAVTNVSRDRLERYFLHVGGVYQVVPELRQMVVFAAHDVIKDAPFTRVDVVTCRNLLIYLQPAVQQKVLSLFHFALNRNGTLVLGPSEGIGPLDRDFDLIEKHWRVFKKTRDARMPVGARLETSPVSRVGAPQTVGGPRHSLSQLLGTYDTLLDDVMPASLLVTDRGELVHSFAGASRFIRTRDGRQGLDVLDLVDPELKMVLGGGIKRALQEESAVVYRSVQISGEDRVPVGHDVALRRVTSKKGGPPFVLISLTPKNTPVPGDAKPRETEITLDEVKQSQLATLEAELTHTKENLQAAIEELHASNEELQASNEELQASNEELQSTNEELQSVNEELYTVNAEYQRKITELTELTNDMDNLLSSTDVGTIFLDSQLRIRKFTPRMAETFSLMSHDVGRSIETFVQHVDYPALVGDLKRVVTTGIPVERELRESHGKAFFMRILPYRVKGTADGVVMTLIDVSGLKAAEDALFHERYLLNSLLAGVPDAIYFKDARGKFIRTNEVMAHRLGLTNAKEAVAKSAFEVPNQVVAMDLHRADEAVLENGTPVHDHLEKRVSPGGETTFDKVTRLPLRNRTEEVVGVIVLCRDVTLQKRADEKIQEAVRLRDQFLAMLSHELRNPLGAIVTATSLLRSAQGDGSPDKFLDILDRQSKQMARLLDDLLEASRVTQNKIELRKSPIDLGAVLRDALDAARPGLETAGLALTTRIAEEPLVVDGDPARLQQIHVNLLSNATKYTPSGGHVCLEATREGDEVVIRVTDDGVGIPVEMIESMFDLFVQSKRTLDRSAGGLGVGLTLVRSLVEMHGGRVTAHSEGEGKGSQFVVRLPLLKSQVPFSSRDGARAKTRGGARIVVVEDNDDSRELLVELLQSQRYECEAASTGPEGLALIKSYKPDIALLDVGLPEMDGFEVARSVRLESDLDGTRLVALTGYGRSTDRTAAREAGFDEHLVKPVRPDKLLALLAALTQPSPASAADGAAPPQRAPLERHDD